MRFWPGSKCRSRGALMLALSWKRRDRGALTPALPDGEGVTAGEENKPGRRGSLAHCSCPPAGGTPGWGPPSLSSSAAGGAPGWGQSPFAPSPLWGEGWGEGLPANLKIYKISKRFGDDSSAVCLATNLQIENTVVTRASSASAASERHRCELSKQKRL